MATYTTNPETVITIDEAVVRATIQSIPQSLRERLESLADAVLTSNRLIYTSPYSGICYGAGGGYNALGPYTDFQGNTALCRPQAFSNSGLLNVISVLADTQEDGKIADYMALNGTVGRNNMFSTWFTWVDMIYSHFLRTGTTAAYNTYKDNIDELMLAVDALCDEAGLFYSEDGYIHGWDWNDSAPTTGYDLGGNLHIYRGLKQLSTMALAAGDTNIYGPRVAPLGAAIQSTFWDAGRGLYRNSTGQNNSHQVPLTAFAVLLGLGSDESRDLAIDALRAGCLGGIHYNDDNHEKNGAIRYTPATEPYEVELVGPEDGYIKNGYWTVFSGWVAKAIFIKYPNVAHELMQRAATLLDDNVNKCFEWFYETGEGAGSADNDTASIVNCLVYYGDRV